MIKSLKGQLLLDGGSLRGSYFDRAVVLICQHDEEGALGLVLTRPSENKVGEMLVAELPETIREQWLFGGGPVQPSALSFLHSDALSFQGNVLPNLSLSHSLETLVELGESYSSLTQIRLFAGYAGWSAGQLEQEMQRKSWLVHPASLDLIFHRDPARLWKQILLQKGVQYRLLADAPEDLSSN